MNKSINHEIRENANKEQSLFYIGWAFIFMLAPFGNTSLGVFFLLLNMLYLLKNKKTIILERNPSIILMGIFIGIMVLSNLTATLKDIAFLSTLGFAFVILTIFVGTQRLATKDEFLEKLLQAFIISSFVSSVYTLTTYFYYDLYRARALFTATNGAGTLFLISTIITIGYFLSPKNKMKRRSLLIIPIVVMTIALIFTFSRGAWLGIFVAGFFLLLLQKKSRTLLIVLLIIAGGLISFNPSLNERFYKIFSISANMDRVQIWQGTINMIADHPLLGVGTGMFAFEYGPYNPTGDDQVSFAFAHNIFLQIAAEFGLIGFTVFSLILLFVAKKGFYGILGRDPIYQSLVAAFLGILTHQMVDCTIYGLEIGGLFWLISGLILHLPKNKL